MDILTRDALRELMEYRSSACVSIYMPAERMGAETTQNPIRLKNLLGRAETILVDEHGWRSPEAKHLLAPAHDLLGSRPLWQHMGDGFALFIGPDMLSFYRVPQTFDELVVVNDRYHIKPLLPLLSADGLFYIVGLSLGAIRVWQASRYGFSEVNLQNAPTSLEDTLKYDEFERTLQFRTATGAPPRQRGSGRDAIFHGHGGGGDEVQQKENILRYLREIDAAVCAQICTERAPIVLAGTAYLRGMYAAISHYPHLVAEGIDGNPNHVPAAELHRQAWDLVAPVFREEQVAAARAYEQARGSDSERASDDIEVVVPASYYGRVAILFVDRHRQQWGTFDRDMGVIDVHDQRQAGDADLIDVATVHTLTNAGNVYAVDPEEMPGETAVAAVFRY